MDVGELRRLLETRWGIDPDDVTQLTGGMNSAAWDVREGSSRWVAKTVPERDSRGFEAGLRAALIVDAGGIPAGAPVPTRDGALSAGMRGSRTALLSWVEGRQLDGVGSDVAIMAATLAKAHGLLRASDVPDAPQLDWLDADAPHLDVEPWVRPAVTRVLREWAGVRDDLRTWGFVHGDPAPEAFIESHPRGVCGLIDWASGFYGPCLFDVASAVMYVGPEAKDTFVEAYLAAGGMSHGEVDRGLLPMLRFRWAVQASYFALRMTERDLTGITDDRGNQKGLDDARRFLKPT